MEQAAVGAGGTEPGRWRLVRRLALALAVLVPLYYLGGML